MLGDHWSCLKMRKSKFCTWFLHQRQMIADDDHSEPGSGQCDVQPSRVAQEAGGRSTTHRIASHRTQNDNVLLSPLKSVNAFDLDLFVVDVSAEELQIRP